MAKTAAFTVRIPEDVKKALEKAAEDDHRTVSSLVELVLVRHLRERKYLKEDKAKAG